jgi:hypothetical protein
MRNSYFSSYHHRMTRKGRPRTERRARERTALKLVRDRQKLAALMPGGAPEHPIVVTSTAVIPGRARGTRCPLCDGALRLDDETAETRGGRLLRAAHVTCVVCGVARRLWFHVTSPLPC